MSFLTGKFDLYDYAATESMEHKRFYLGNSQQRSIELYPGVLSEISAILLSTHVINELLLSDVYISPIAWNDYRFSKGDYIDGYMPFCLTTLLHETESPSNDTLEMVHGLIDDSSINYADYPSVDYSLKIDNLLKKHYYNIRKFSENNKWKTYEIVSLPFV